MPHKILDETASQTAGPYLHIGMYPSSAGLPVRTQEKPNVMAGAGAFGERIRIEGRALDGNRDPVRDVQVELWQADANGKYDHPDDTQKKKPDPNFNGFGRAVGDFETGEWWFESVKPGQVSEPDEQAMAPHICVSVFARGINIHLNTRIYFDDETDANAIDPVLNLVDSPSRRETMIAKRISRAGQIVYEFDIVLQGDDETVFFDV